MLNTLRDLNLKLDLDLNNLLDQNTPLPNSKTEFYKYLKLKPVFEFIQSNAIQSNSIHSNLNSNQNLNQNLFNLVQNKLKNYPSFFAKLALVLGQIKNFDQKDFKNNRFNFKDHIQSDLKSLVWVINIPDNQELLIDESDLNNLNGLNNFLFLNHLIILNIGKNSRVYYKSNNHNIKMHFKHLIVEQAKDSLLEVYSVQCENNLSRSNYEINLNGEGANFVFNGVYWVGDSAQLDNHIRVQHRASHTTSHQRCVGLAEDHSNITFDSQAIAHKNLKNISAHQHNHNLLLSKYSKINTRPVLEIYTDDVNCSHGATVGELDQNLLFYLQSRGFSKEQAYVTLQHAFVMKLISEEFDKKINNLDLKSWAENLIHSKRSL